MSAVNLQIIVVVILILVSTIECDGFRGRGRRMRLFRNRPPAATTTLSPNPQPNRRPPIPSGTSLTFRNPFRGIGGNRRRPAATTTTAAAPTTITTIAPVPTTTIAATPAPPASPTGPPRPPDAPAGPAPQRKPLDTGKTASVVPDEFKNIGKGQGNRPVTPSNAPNSTRPSTLEKTGSLKPKMPRQNGDSGNDQPTTNSDDSLLKGLFSDESLKYTKPRNIRHSSMPGPPDALPQARPTQRGVDSGSDGSASRQVDSLGKEFWVAFMDNRVEIPVNKPLEIYVAAGHYASGVKATVKMWYYSPYGSKAEVFDVTQVKSDSVKILTVPAYMRNIVNGVFKKGIRIVSDLPISVVGFNYERFSADAFRVIPLDALSSHYIAVTYGQPWIRTQLACMAVRDDTVLQVTLPHQPPAGVIEPVVDVEGVRFNPGESFNLTLNAFEVLALRSVGDLTGANLMASEKVACFSGNVRAHVEIGAQGWSRDHLISQLLPVSTWQKEFVIAPVPSGLAGKSLGGTHIFVSSKANTNILVSEEGKSPFVIRIAKARGKAFYTKLSSFAHVMADKPIQIAQVFGSQQGKDAAVTGDPSMIIYSAINQYSNLPQTTLPPAGYFGYINKVLIIIDRDERSGLRMSRKRNRNLESRNWVQIPNTNLVARYLNVDEDRLTQIYHTNSNVKFYVQYYGFSDRESYTYGGAISMSLGCDHTPVKPGDGIDNDCDGKIDEEIIDKYDNDGDGLIDEDTGFRHPYELVGGKEYVLTFMENAARELGQQIHLYVAVAPDVKATQVKVTVSQPLLLTNGIPTNTHTVTKGKFHMINLNPRNIVIYGTTRSKQAIKISANHRIVVYALNRKLFSMDGNLLFPVDRLGTEYYTVSYSPSHVATQFAVVATEPGTVLDIVFPPEVVNKPWSDGRIQVPWTNLMWTNNHKLKINLKQFEALQMQSGHNLPTDFQNRYLRGDLTGTYIKSNKPIAVFSGNGRVNMTPSKSRDHLVEQMPPVSSWGKEYIVTPTPGRTVGEYYRIIASEPNTKVIVDRNDNNYKVFTIGKGEFNQINIVTGGVSASIYADKPIMVVMFMKSQTSAAHAQTEPGDPAMIVIPHTYQWMYKIHFGTPIADYQKFYVTVVLQKKYRNGLRLNGNLVPQSSFILTPRLGTKNYAYVILDIQQASNYQLMHDDPFASFFAQLYGTRDRESVGYVLGVNLPIENKKYVYYPKNPPVPGGFTNDPYDIYSVELCNDGIDNDGDFLIDEDCDHAHEYYAMFMTNTVPSPMDHSLEIHCVSTSNKNYVRLTTGYINKRILRHEVEKNIIQEVTLNRDETILFTVPGHYRAQLSRSGYFDTQFKGVVVESDWALECFAFNKDTGSADGWLMKDYYDLGNSYVVSAAHPYSNHQLVGLVATEDATRVSVTLPVNNDPNLFYVDVQGYRYYAGDTFNITLDRLQIFQLDVQNGFDLTGAFINANKPVAVFAGNERTGIPYQNYVGWDHAADQIPKIATSVDLDPKIGTAYRYDVMPTAGNQQYDTYQCVGWAAGTRVNIKQNGISMSSKPLNFMGIVKENLRSTNGPVQIFSNNPLMCEQFAWSDPNRPGNAPELAANVLANTFYDSRPWFRFVVPKVSTLSGNYDSHLTVSFNLEQLFKGESPAFFLDGQWVENVNVSVVADQAWFTVKGLGYGPHAISSAIVDNSDNSVKKALLRFTTQLFLNSGTESISYSPVPEQLYKT